MRKPLTLREHLTVETGVGLVEMSVGDDIWAKLEELGVLDMPLLLDRFIGFAVLRVRESGRLDLLVEDRVAVDDGRLLAVLDRTVGTPPEPGWYKWPVGHPPEE